MLTSLRIRNFKSWRDTGPIRLAPLTVIFGANSAGKSSLGHLLLTLKQTAVSSDRKRALNLMGEGVGPRDRTSASAAEDDAFRPQDSRDDRPEQFRQHAAGRRDRAKG